MLSGVVYVVVFGPLFDDEHERRDSPVEVTVAFEQMGIADAHVVVYIEIAVDLAFGVKKKFFSSSLDQWSVSQL